MMSKPGMNLRTFIVCAILSTITYFVTSEVLTAKPVAATTDPVFCVPTATNIFPVTFYPATGEYSVQDRINCGSPVDGDGCTVVLINQVYSYNTDWGHPILMAHQSHDIILGCGQGQDSLATVFINRLNPGNYKWDVIWLNEYDGHWIDHQGVYFTK